MEEMHESFNTSWAFENSSNISSPGQVTAENLYTYGERIFVAAAWAFISTFGMIGNSLVVIAVLLSRKLRTATNVFVVNLAVADFLTSLFLIWSVVALLGKHGWPIPEAEWLCSAGGFMMFLCTGVSLYNLAAIALNRFILITKSVSTYRKIYTPVNIGFMTALIWIISITFFISLPLAGIGGFGYNKKHSTCSDLDHHMESETFQLAQAIFLYPMPLVTIVLCYVLVFRHMKQHFRQQKMRELSDVAVISSSNFSKQSATNISVLSKDQPNTDDLKSTPLTRNEPAVASSRRSQRIDEMEMKITKNLFLVVCAFCLFFTPYFIELFIPGSNYLLLYFGISVLANSTINPVIYSKRHPHFKVVLSCMLRCRYAEIPEPSGTLKMILSSGKPHHMPH